jgi:hypothetical protein
MANTTNYNWETPDDTDLVKDGAAAIRTLGSSVDTTTKALNPSTTLGDIEYRSATANTNTRLAIGTTGQVLSVVGGVPAWATSDDANAIQNAIVDAKGDIVAASAADTPARLAVGTDNQRLVAASGETTGLKYVSDTQNTVIDAEGDLLVGDAADALQRLAIGSNAQVLTVDTTVDGKIKWATPAGGGGKILQVVSATHATQVNSSSATPTDSGLTATITPAATSSKILVLVAGKVAKTNGSADNSIVMDIVRSSTTIYSSSGLFTNSASALQIFYSSSYVDSPSTTSATTYKVQISSENGTSLVAFMSGNTTATITLLEIGV